MPGKHALPLLVAVAAALMSCVAAAAESDPQPLREPVGCTLSFDDVVAERADAGAVQRRFAFASDAGLFHVQRAVRLRGECLEAILAHAVDTMYLSDGRIATLGSDLRMEEAAPGYTYLRPDLVSLPDTMGDGFVMAHRVAYVDRTSGLAELFVGLWASRTGSSLKVFLKHADGTVRPAHELLASRAVIDSVRYFPAVDVPGGTLSLTMRDSGVMDLIWMDWTHPEDLIQLVD